MAPTKTQATRVSELIQSLDKLRARASVLLSGASPLPPSSRPSGPCGSRAEREQAPRGVYEPCERKGSTLMPSDLPSKGLGPVTRLGRTFVLFSGLVAQRDEALVLVVL